MKRTRWTIILATALMVLASPLLAQVKDYKKIKYPKLPAFTVPTPENFTLPNGMKVFLLEDHELPLISVNARIATGSNYEPADKVGLAGIFGQVLREGGTTTRSGDELNEFLEARAASVETGMGGDFGTASMNCLKEDFDDVLGVFVDVLRNPAFIEDKLDLAKVGANTNISRRNDDIAGITGREFSALIYGSDSPLSRNEEYATIAAIGRDDLVAWHSTYYHPNNMLLGVVGDFDAAEMRKALEAAFSGWERGPDVKLPEVAYNKTMKPGVYYIEKADVTQANIRLGHLGINTKNPDYFAVQVMNEVFGGGFAARLFSNVRSKKGLAYNVGGGIRSSYLREGIFQVALSTKSTTMAEAVEALQEEITDIIENPPSDAEMELAKSAILQSSVFNYTSRAGILNQQLTYEYYGLPSDWLEQYPKMIEKVSRAEVARVAKEYIHPDQLVLMVVGNEGDFDRPVSSFGEVTTLDITIPAMADASADVERSDEAIARGRDLIQRMSTKIGGNDPSEITSLRRSMQMKVSMGGQEMGLSEVTEGRLPDQMRLTMKTPMGDQTMVMNGDSGFAIAGGQIQDLPAAMVAEQRAGLRRELMMLALYAHDIDAVASDSDIVGGEQCDNVVANIEDTGTTLCIAGDGRVLRQSYQGKNPMSGAPGKMVITYDDYRDIEGLSIPFHRNMTFEGQPLVDSTVDGFDVNPALDPTIFEKPAS